MKYVSIAAAEENWFFVQSSTQEPIVLRVVVWAIDGCGNVIGLVSDCSQPPNSKNIILPPPSNISGHYKHLKDLSPAELNFFAKNHAWAALAIKNGYR